MRLLITALLGALVAVGCSSSDAPEGVEVADGWSVEVVRDDLTRPTQVVRTPDGGLWVAQLDGGEGAGEGQVLDLGAEGTADPRVVLDGLLKPTGLAVLDDAVYVQEEQVIVRAERDGDQLGEPAELPATELPYNGRSQGTLVVLPGGGIAHEASGTGTGPDPAQGSGTLYAIDPDEGLEAEPRPLAEGFKGPYGFTPVGDGELLVGDMGDGSYDGEPQADELNRLTLGDGLLPDGGWPACIGDRDPVDDNGGDQATCDDTLAPLALFPPSSSPTSVAVTEGGRILVALWVEGRVVEVGEDGSVTDVATGLENPQHLLADDGDVLLTVHLSGELLRLTPPE